MLTPVLPLKLSAAGIRVFGYMIESQLRVARIFGRAALQATPFASPLREKASLPNTVRHGAPRPKVTPVQKPRVAAARGAGAVAPARPAVVAEAPAAAQKPAPATRKPVKTAPRPVTAPAGTLKTDQPKAAAIPPARSARVQDDTPSAAPEAIPAVTNVAAPEPAQVGTRAEMSRAAPAEQPVKTAETAAPRRPRAPSMPPSMPAPVRKVEAE